MAVQVWVGDKPEHPNERRAIVALANGLERLENLYLLLANFNVGGRTIDLVVIKHDAIFIIELKHCDGKIFGGVNGAWFVESANNERKRLNPGRKNPYNQVISYYYSLINFLNEHRAEILSDQKAAQVNFRSCRRLVVIAPTIQEGSEIELDWKVELKGLDELPAFLVTERSTEIMLTPEEMLTIPRLLGCTRWQDINELIAGVLPGWHADTASHERSDSPTVLAPTLQPVHAAPPATASSASFFQNIWLSLQTVPGRMAFGMNVVAVILLVLLVSRSADAVPPPPSNEVSALTPIGEAAGGVFSESMELDPSDCVWSGFQVVGKRWDAKTQTWLSVGIGGTVAELAPEIVVTLERVDYCGDKIVLTWGVRNNSARTIRFPLRSENISIRDPIGNEYIIDDSLSQPANLWVKPESREEGVAIVSRPVSQNAPSLLVRLKHQPFGEASWLVSLEGN